MVIETKDRIYIVEFKCNQSAQRAIERIKEKGYHRGYDGIGKEVYLLGINFLRKGKNNIRLPLRALKLKGKLETNFKVPKAISHNQSAHILSG